MMALSAKEVGEYAYKAGVTGSLELATAIAVASLESGFNPGSLADDSDDLSYGLWQINMKGSLGPSRRAQYGLANNQALYDPATNARVMAALSKNGKDWSAWSTFTRGPAKVLAVRYTTTAAEIIAAGGGGGIIGAIGNASDAAGAAGDAMGDIATATRATYNWVSDRNNWTRVMKVVAGAGLLIGGLYLVTRPIVTSQIEKVATAVKG